MAGRSIVVVEAVVPEGSLGGRYRLNGLLGRGGMADVHRATDEVLLRQVAVKIFRRGAGTEEGRRRFQFEVELAASLDHPQLVRLFDAGTDGGQPWCVMQLITGGTLREHPKPLPVDWIYAIGADIAWALEYLHSQGVVHRDIKPSNVLLGERGEAYLSDFGVAVLQGHVNALSQGDLLGTPAYLAPEQVRGQATGPASDVYSLGLLLLECVTGRREYQGEPLAAALARLEREPHVPADVEPGLGRLIQEMTRLDPTGRPTAAEVARRLIEPDPVVEQPAPERVGKGSLRPILISVGAAALLATGAILGWGPAFSAFPSQLPAGSSDSPAPDLRGPGQNIADALVDEPGWLADVPSDGEAGGEPLLSAEVLTDQDVSFDGVVIGGGPTGAAPPLPGGAAVDSTGRVVSGAADAGPPPGASTATGAPAAAGQDGVGGSRPAVRTGPTAAPDTTGVAGPTPTASGVLVVAPPNPPAAGTPASPTGPATRTSTAGATVQPTTGPPPGQDDDGGKDKKDKDD